MMIRFFLLIIICSGVLVSCAPQPPEPQTPTIEREIPDYQPPPPIVWGEPPPPPRLPKPEVTLPEPEVEEPTEEPGVLGKYKCYEGNPQRKMTLTKTVKRLRAGWFGRSSILYLYDCHGTNNCQKEFVLKYVEHGRGEHEMSCLEHAKEQDIFSVCKDSSSKKIATIYGELMQLVLVVNGTTTTTYCESSLPL